MKKNHAGSSKNTAAKKRPEPDNTRRPQPKKPAVEPKETATVDVYPQMELDELATLLLAELENLVDQFAGTADRISQLHAKAQAVGARDAALMNAVKSAISHCNDDIRALYRAYDIDDQ